LLKLRGYTLLFVCLMEVLGLFTAPAAETSNSVYLNEVVTDAQSGLADEDKTQSGWIEIHNGKKELVNLRGWFLSDEASNPTKWRFPAVALLPGGYMVIFASGKDRTNVSSQLHTNFRLSHPSGYLALHDRATNLVSDFSAISKISQGSYGRVPGEMKLHGPLPKATPGKRNVIEGKGFAPEAAFSRSSGNFLESFLLELNAGAPGSAIRYSLDGSLPTTNSPVYQGPLLITNTSQIRARVFRPGLLPGPPASGTYLKLHTNVFGFSSDLPLLVVHSLGIQSPALTKGSYAHAEFFEPVNGRASLTNKPSLASHASFRVRGSSSSGLPKPGFALEFLDEFSNEADRSPLGLPPESDWVLYAPNQFDPVLIHNPFIHQLSRDMGHYSPRTRFVEVFVVNSAGRIREGHYSGIYVLEEKIKIGKHRVAIERAGANDLKMPEISGGYVLKFDRLGPDEVGFNIGNPSIAFVDPKEHTLSLPQRLVQKEYLKNFLGEFERALNGPQWKDPVSGYPAYFDVKAAIDFHVLEVLSGNVDAMALSTHFYKPRNGKITYGPHWDFDRALGSTDRRDQNPRKWNTGEFFAHNWWPRLFSDPDFWQLWVDRWQELRLTHFALKNIEGLIDRLSKEVQQAQPREYARWGTEPRGGSYASEIQLMKQWLSNRIDHIDQQLAQPPVLIQRSKVSHAALELTIDASTNSTVYYTLDGTDPRLPQGAVSSNALVYAGPVTLARNSRLVARSWDPGRQQRDGPPISTPWSRPVSATFEPAKN